MSICATLQSGLVCQFFNILAWYFIKGEIIQEIYLLLILYITYMILIHCIIVTHVVVLVVGVDVVIC